MNTVNPFMTGSSSKSAKDSSPTAQSAEKPPARLCYVDDSRTSAYVVKRLLRPYGYVVEHFESAEPALIALVKDNYDLLLTDLKVSSTGMDGDDLVRALRNSGHEKISSLPVIVITGSTDETVLKEVYEAGANYILSKPVNGDELDSHIRDLVHGAPTETEASNITSDTAGEVATADQQTDSFFPTTNVNEPIVESGMATVVPFGSDPVFKPSAQTGVDAIPVLNSLQEKAKTDEVLNLDNGVTPRRVLKVADAKHKPADITKIGKENNVTPQPLVAVKPASRVTPTIKSADPESNEVTSELTASNTASTETKTTTAAAGTAGNLTPEQLAARQKMLKAKELAKKRKQLAAVAARKMATAASNAQPAGASQSNQADLNTGAVHATGQPGLSTNNKTPRKRKPKFDINKIATDHLTLEPKDSGHAGDGSPAPKAREASAMPAPAVEMPARPVPKSEQSPINNLGSDIGAAAHAEPHAGFTSVETRGTTAGGAETQMEADAATNILQEMERYPLVEADLSSNYTPSRVMSMVGSILELYGPKKIITAVFLVILGFFGYSGYKEYFDDGVPVEVTKVEQGEIFQSITVPGKVVSKLRVNLTPAIAGRLTHVYVEEGDTVKSGDLLARLDDREANSALKRATASYDSAKEDVVLAQRSVKRLQQAYEKGAIAKHLVEEAEAELRAAKSREAIVAEEVRTAKLSLENPRIVAPFAGTITARYVEVGQWVVPSETLFTLIDEKQREVEVQVDAADSGGIAVGQTVTLSSDAFPGLEWNESVTRLAAATSNVGNANTVSVYISLGNNAPSLRFGQQVDADIRTAWNPNALKLPFGAITNRAGKTYVATVQDNKVHFVEVVTGIEDFSHVEVLQGVNVGQTVIMANGLDLQENQKVFVDSNAS